ncbi:P-loop containing nucleoside triphosphate hydrolase protein [Gorgonomyces haynaldii]|nr:P-loop containing nucleoside triphosphate hydrolase protein [Gorgonomyces haynaldii]
MQVYTIREPGGIRFSLAPVPVDRNPFERPFEWFPIENPQSPFGLPLHNQESPQTMTTIDSEPVDTDTSGHLASRLLQLFKPLIECSKTINTLLSESKIPHSLVLKLPRIAVVGTESAGKSTVIQRLARRKLFPTGDTITTRMPIVLDLRHTDSDQVSIKLSKDDGQGMDDVDPDADLEQEIKTRTTVMLSQHNGHAKGVMSKEFRIQVHANDVTNMELMDLPGLVSVATLSGEPENLPTATREITESYVKDPNTMVLMIVPGNERSRNSLISTIIQQLGAEHRTIGVLTKCDLLVEREYETLLKKMRGDPTYSLPLQLGYVALNSGDNRAISFDNVIHQEQAFFKHFFDTLNTNPHTVGIESLVKVISSEYPKFCVSRIRGFQAHLSTIKTAVEKRLQELIEITPQLFQSVKDEKFCSGSWKTLDMTQIVGYHTFWNGSLSSVLSPMNDYQTHSGGRKLAIWADPTATVRMKHAIKTCTSIETTIKPLYEKLLDSYKSQIIRTFQEGTQSTSTKHRYDGIQDFHISSSRRENKTANDCSFRQSRSEWSSYADQIWIHCALGTRNKPTRQGVSHAHGLRRDCLVLLRTCH